MTVLNVVFESLTREQVANLLKLTKDLDHERLVIASDDDKGRCRFHCRTTKEAYLAGVVEGIEMAFNPEARTPEEAWDNWKRKGQIYEVVKEPPN